MVVCGTEALAIGGVKRVRELYFLPAYKFAHGTLLSAVAMKLNVKQAGTFQLVWHPVVHSVYGQLHVQSLRHLVPAVKHGNGCYLLRLLYGQ